MSNSEWRPKVGERVAIHGVVVKTNNSQFPLEVETENGNTYWYAYSSVLPIPASPEPRKPWEVLREAANLIAVKSNHLDGGGTFEFLEAEADRLEAAAAPKLPTLAETVRAFVDSKVAPGNMTYEVMVEALARAENGA